VFAKRGRSGGKHSINLCLCTFEILFKANCGNSKVSLKHKYSILKGTVSRDFRLHFFHELVSPQPLSIPLVPFCNSKIRRDIGSLRYTTGVVGTGGKYKKSSPRTVLIVLVEHLWVVELTYRSIFSKM
jgi:hypothetical protein